MRSAYVAPSRLIGPAFALASVVAARRRACGMDSGFGNYFNKAGQWPGESSS